MTPDATESARTSTGPIPHTKRGPGSAFAQRQRYAYVDDLITARSTDDIPGA